MTTTEFLTLLLLSEKNSSGQKSNSSDGSGMEKSGSGGYGYTQILESRLRVYRVLLEKSGLAGYGNQISGIGYFTFCRSENCFTCY